MSDNSTTIHTGVAVIGSGPGGYAAAFRAADKGLKVTLIDSRPKLGGVCLNVGCIPSKALLHLAKIMNEARHAKGCGLDFGDPKIDLPAIRAWKESVIAKNSGGVVQLCKARGVQVVQGTAVFIDSERLTLEDSTHKMVCFEHAILATGSSPAAPPGFDMKNPRIMDSTRALALEDIPARLLVVGGGYIGLELATVYAALGSRVVIVEMLDGLLPGADRDLVRPVATLLKERVEAVHLGTKVTKVEDKGTELLVTFEATEPIPAQTFDRILVATGRRPNSRGIGIENTKAKIDAKGFVQVDAQRRTADPRIFAIGDVAGEPMLAHKATREGIVAADAIGGEKSAFDPAAIPAVVFTDPEIAWCGLTENEAKAEGRKVEVRRFPWGASGRAATLGRPEGLTKIVCEPESGRILGVAIVGAGAGELIAEGTLAIELGAVAEDLAATIHPHPTLSETVMECAELFHGSATHLFRAVGKKA